MRTRLIILAMVVALTGCSNDSGSPASGNPAASPPAPAATTAGSAGDGLPDPCSLLTKTEVDGATGATFGEGAINTMVSQEHLRACDWPSAGVATVQVLVTTVDAFDTSRQTAAQTYGSTDDVSVPKAKRGLRRQGRFPHRDGHGRALPAGVVRHGRRERGRRHARPFRQGRRPARLRAPPHARDSRNCTTVVVSTRRETTTVLHL